ncbi:transporter [Lysinibacillus odysseyi 34hs-1 = NBRC 100172]|uniref:Transporter n=1 Tax=Lysinibacillus odysseyi 34hs-1 = NBRC 100172 TaxID=1220589 RepID=A0A0A3IUX0_9BACI|nr:transporter [Lysinibacillus odysseyi 34hs-1 = NBRC 100172]
MQLDSKVLLFVASIVLLATTLRTPLTLVGPIISFIRDDLGISNVLGGFLTTIPLLAFAVVSPFAPRIARKFGMEWTLFYSVLLLSAGILLRSFGTITFLLIGTILIGVAISFGNVLIPSFFKMRYPLHIGLLTGIYTVSMNLSAGIGAGVSYPIAEASNWQIALASGLVVAVAALIFWIPQLRGEKVSLGESSSDSKGWSSFIRSPIAIAVMLAMGLQSFFFYTTAAWIPEIYIAQGIDASKAGWLFSVLQFFQIPMTFLTPILAGKMANQRPIVVVFTVFYLIGFTGVLMEWTDYAIVWMICLGFAGGSSFSLAMMFFTLRTKTAYAAAELSGFAQSIGYLLAAVGPIGFGLLKDITGSWFIPNVIFVITAIILFISAYIAGNNRIIDN